MQSHAFWILLSHLSLAETFSSQAGQEEAVVANIKAVDQLRHCDYNRLPVNAIELHAAEQGIAQ